MAGLWESYGLTVLSVEDVDAALVVDMCRAIDVQVAERKARQAEAEARSARAGRR